MGQIMGQYDSEEINDEEFAKIYGEFVGKTRLNWDDIYLPVGIIPVRDLIAYRRGYLLGYLGIWNDEHAEYKNDALFKLGQEDGEFDRQFE